MGHPLITPRKLPLPPKQLQYLPAKLMPKMNLRKKTRKRKNLKRTKKEKKDTSDDTKDSKKDSKNAKGSKDPDVKKSKKKTKQGQGVFTKMNTKITVGKKKVKTV